MRTVKCFVWNRLGLFTTQNKTKRILKDNKSGCKEARREDSRKKKSQNARVCAYETHRLAFDGRWVSCVLSASRVTTHIKKSPVCVTLTKIFITDVVSQIDCFRVYARQIPQHSLRYLTLSLFPITTGVLENSRKPLLLPGTGTDTPVCSPTPLRFP